MNKAGGDTRNLVVVTKNPVDAGRDTFQVEPLQKIKAYKVQSLGLNLDAASTTLPIGPALPNMIFVYSGVFPSMSGNNYSFVNGARKNLIAAYPIHIGSSSTSGGRTTWLFKTRNSWTWFTNPYNVNRYDLSVYLDANEIVLGALDTFSVVLETINEV